MPSKRYENKHWSVELKKYVDDDITEPVLRFRRGKRTYDDYEIKKKTVGGYKAKLASNPNYYKEKMKKQSSRSVYNQATTTKKTNKEVVIKVTGNDTHLEQLHNHLCYISRNQKVTLTDKYGNEITIAEAEKELNLFEDIPKKSELKKERRETFHMIFSLQSSQDDINKMEWAVHKTMLENFPDQYFVTAKHEDTDNNHIHLVMRARNDITNRAINMNVKTIRKLKSDFADNLNTLGIEAEAKRFQYNLEELQKQQQENTHFRITSFGEAPYLFKKNEKESYYVTMKTNEGKDMTIWGSNLKDLIEKNNIHTDEYCRFAITNTVPTERTVRIKDKNNPNILYEKVIYENQWDVSIKGRSEKRLKPLTKRQRDAIQKESIKVIYLNNAEKEFLKTKPEIKTEAPKPEVKKQQIQKDIQQDIKKDIEI